LDAKLRNLSGIPLGSPVHVRELLHEDETRIRLLELGLLPGAEVRLVRRAPLGCPVEVDVAGARFSLRREMLDGILVDPLVDPAA
jgi:ferrous iron transport protein A